MTTTAPTSIRDFPLCGGCGAAPSSREEEACRFCGTVLTWAEFDLRSRRRVVLKEVESEAMDAALRRVEKSLEFHRASAGRREIKRRFQRFRRASRAKRERLSHDTTSGDAELVMTAFEAAKTPAGAGVLVVGVGVSVLLGLTSGPLPAMCAVLFTLLALSGFNAAGNRSRRRTGVPGRHSHWAAPMGILELGPPESFGRVRRRRGRRVTARLLRHRTREFTVGVDEDLHAGDVGVAYLRGDRIFRFKVQEHLSAE